jgi:hypothetical protein
MDRIFSIHRFWLLVRRHGVENRKVYALALGVIAFIVLLISILIGYQGNALLGMFPVMLCFAGSLISSTLFTSWSDFGRSSLYLMLPATSTEKFLTALFYGFFVFLPVFILSYFISGIIFLKISWSSFTVSGFLFQVKLLYSPRLFLDIMIAFLLIQSITIAGVIQFKKRQFLVSVMILVLLYLFYTLTFYFLVKIATNTDVTTWLMPFYNYGFGFATKDGQQWYHNYYSFRKVIANLFLVVWILTIFLIYLSAWYKLREREL